MSGIILCAFSKKNKANPLRFDKDMAKTSILHMPGGETKMSQPRQGLRDPCDIV